jgi:integrase
MIYTGIFKSASKVFGDGKTVADLAVKLIQSLFNYAKGLKGSDRIDGLPETNPVAGIGWYIESARKRTSHIADSDLPKFWQCLDAKAVNPTHATAIRLMLLTGIRVGAARQLTWQHVDLANRVIKIPAALMKGKRNFELPIVNGLHEVLTAWRQRGVERSGYVFPSTVAGKHVTEIRPTLQYVAKQAGMAVITPHDLRRTFARACKKAGIGKWQAADMLAHSTGSLTDDYAGTSDADDLRAPLQLVTDYLLTKCGANVVNLTKAA